MSDDLSKAEKAAGHVAAVKVGGARQVQQRRPRRESDGDEEAAAAVGGVADPVTVGMFSQSPLKLNVTSGQPNLESNEREFPTQAVKQIHDKPMPSCDQRPKHTQQHIQQPRK